MKGIMISWGTPVAGRERLALEEFASFMQWATALKAQNKIARFDVYVPEFGEYESFSGFAILEGTAKQIDELGRSDEFNVRTQRTMTCVHGLRINSLKGGDEVANHMKAYANALLQLKL